MEILTEHELTLRKKEILRKIRAGAIFIHPTDTIYGISGNAENEETVQKIREIKGRFDKPFSIWAPSVDWIKDIININQRDNEWVHKLPGPYTLIIQVKNKDCVANNVNPDNGTLGVRIPDHWFSSYVRELGIPLITTSANKIGESFMTSLENLDPDIEKHVEFIIYEGEKTGKPSKIVDLEKEVVVER